jgi:glutathione synthase/RimK-type ligase-like ATP-grasp enzyme
VNDRSPGVAVGVLVPIREVNAPAPDRFPMGRAALRLAAEGIDVVFGEVVEDGRIWGQRATDSGWEKCANVPIGALYDRYPAQGETARFSLIADTFEGVPVANGPAVARLCRDKLTCQRVLEAAGESMPSMTGNPDEFSARLRDWGRAFLKPRFGSCGRGVLAVEPGDPLPSHGEGMLPGILDPMILQQAVPPPADWAGVSLRVLVQRAPAAGWVACLPVARVSHHSPVVSVALGAVAERADALLRMRTVEEASETAVRVAQRLAETVGLSLLIELGVDFVVDSRGDPHLIEVNSRPHGRLASLAARDAGVEAVHFEAIERPFRYLSWRFGAA